LRGAPAKVVDEIKVDLPRPRNDRTSEFMEYVDRLHSDLTVKKG
jgi:ABC-type nitrate/sulfonate/bicarbonate transport system ATPase subunit